MALCDYSSARIPDGPGALVEIREGPIVWEGVPVDAREWCAEHGINYEVYTVARYLKSEISSSLPNQYRAAVLEVLINESNDWNRRKKLSWSPADMLLRRTRAEYRYTRGKWGRQRGRWAATSLAPRVGDILFAGRYSHRGYARGAKRFFDSGAFRGARGFSEPDAFLSGTWMKEGWFWVGPIAGIDPYRLALLDKDPGGQSRNVARNNALLRAIREGPGEIEPCPLSLGDLPIDGDESGPEWLLEAMVLLGLVLLL